MQNPYDVAPLQDRGDDEDSTVYEAVGRALSQWEMLESTLGRIFASLCGVPPFRDEGASRAYGVVASSSGRFDMLEEALGVFPGRSKEPAKRLKSLLTRAGRFGARRNEIAHGIVSMVNTNDAFGGYYLLPAHYSSRKRAPMDRNAATPEEITKALRDHVLGKYAYTSAQIDEYRRQFFLLNSEAIGIDHELFAASFDQR